MSVLHTPGPRALRQMTTAELRETFLLDNLVQTESVRFRFTDLDRLSVALVEPRRALKLDPDPQTGTDFFLQRRELGLINIAGPGTVRVDGQTFTLNSLDGLYIGMGAKSVEFHSAESHRPARFYLLSCPAHQGFPTTLIRRSDCKAVELGSKSSANERKIYQYIHLNGVRSSQLVMGFTELAEGSVWNTMPPHTHSRRTEIYFYFDLAQNIVSHFLGAPQETRHLFVHNEQAVLSPSWSIHAGCGTGSYRFIWGMAGENQAFDDMDKIALSDLR